MFVKKNVLKTCARLTGKYLCQSRHEALKKENVGQVFSFDFYKMFLEDLFYRTFPGTCSMVIMIIHQFFEVFFLLTYLMCISVSFGSFCISFCFTYQIIMMKQIVLTLTKFVIYVCWLNKLLPSFLFQINELI